MKFFSLIFCFLLFHLPALAKELKTKSFELNLMDLTAATQPRFDRNKEACALIKIPFHDQIQSIKAEGNVVETIDDGSETYIYMTAGSKFIYIKSAGYRPLKVDFSDYDIYRLEPRLTYILELDVDNSATETQTSQSNPKDSNTKSIFEVIGSDSYADPIDDMVTKANNAFSEKRYGEAVELLKKAAEHKHPEALLSLGLLYENGLIDEFRDYITKDYNKAFELVFKSATQGFAPAQKELSRYYRKGIGTPIDTEKAENWNNIYLLTSTKNSPTNGNDDKKLLNMAMVEMQPEFPGGDAELFRFLNNNINYPPISAEAGVTGRIVVQFVVEKDGTLNDFKIIKAPSYKGKKAEEAEIFNTGVEALKEEAIRVLKLSPKWTPGIQNGTPVRVIYNIPITFNMTRK